VSSPISLVLELY